MAAPVVIPPLPAFLPSTTPAQFARIFQQFQSVRSLIYAQWTSALRDTIRRADDDDKHETINDGHDEHEHSSEHAHRLYDAALKQTVSDFNAVNAVIRIFIAAMRVAAPSPDLSSVVSAVSAIQSLESCKLHHTVRLHQLAITYELERRSPFDEEYARATSDLRRDVNDVIAQINSHIATIRDVQFAQT